VNDQLQEISAGAVLFYLDDTTPEFLLLHYPAGHWDFPKGNIEKNEDEIDTVRREVREETGIQGIDILPGFRSEIRYNYLKSGRRVYKKVTFFLAKASNKNVKISYEHRGYQWLAYDKAVRRVTFQNGKELLKEAYEFLEISPPKKTDESAQKLLGDH
jgi:8-oxo-dGTP pyrophosphatase MutT (NUDIX family)